MDITFESLKKEREQLFLQLAKKEFFQDEQKFNFEETFDLYPGQSHMFVLINLNEQRVIKVLGSHRFGYPKEHIHLASLNNQGSVKLINNEDYYFLDHFNRMAWRLMCDPILPIHELTDYYKVYVRINSNEHNHTSRKCFLFKDGFTFYQLDIWEKIEAFEYVRAAFYHISHQKELDKKFYELIVDSLGFHINEFAFKVLELLDKDYTDKQIAHELKVKLTKVDNCKQKLCKQVNAICIENAISMHIQTKQKLIKACRLFGILPKYKAA